MREPINHGMVALNTKRTKTTMVNIPGVDSRTIQEPMRATTTTQPGVVNDTRGQ